MEENYIVSARKYRPSSFSTVIGQEALTHTLKTAIISGRLAHAYLFCGPRGVGKTTCARIFAKAINCEHLDANGEPCNECESCKAFNEARSYNIIELDAASNNGVDDIRNLNDQVRVPPQIGRYRVFIIDEVHMLSAGAFNAFLKTLEEPPEYAIFILATTEKQKIIPTILSRCQIYDFTRITVPDIVKQLQIICSREGVTAEPAALNVIAQKADGAMRDALSIFDQVNASSQGNITYQSTIENLNVLDYDYYFRLDETFLTADVPQALLIFREIRDKGFDSQFFINGLAQHLRDLMMASTPQTAPLLEMNDDIAQRHVLQASRFTPRFFYRAVDLCCTCDLNYRDASNKQLLVELTLIKICQLFAPAEPDDKPTKLSAIPKTAPAQPAAAAPQPAQAVKAAAQPAPRPMPQPAPQPVVAEPAPQLAKQPAKTAVPRTTLGTSLKINNTALNAPADTSKAAEPATRREAFTPEQLATAWQSYITDHPHEHVIINTMRLSPPERLNDEQYLVQVENDSQIEFLNGKMQQILSYLRDKVQNDYLALDIKIREGGPAPKVLTQREIVEDMKQRNPDFVNVIKDFDLTLA